MKNTHDIWWFTKRGMIDLPSMASTLTTMGEHETVCSQILLVTL